MADYELSIPAITERHYNGLPDDEKFDWREYAALARADIMFLLGYIEGLPLGMKQGLTEALLERKPS